MARRVIAPRRNSERADGAAIESFWNSLPAEERNRIEAELVLTATPFQKQHYQDGQKERGPLFQVVRQSIIDDYVRKVLAKAAA